MILLLLVSAANGGCAYYLVRVGKHGSETLWKGQGVQSYGVCVDEEGDIWVRMPGAASEARMIATPVFISSQLLIVSVAGASVRIWCDAVSEEAFRQLTVAARWPRWVPPTRASEDLST